MSGWRPADGSGSQLVESQAKLVAARFRAFYDQPVLFEYHHQAMGSALVQTESGAQFRQTAIAGALRQHGEGGESSVKYLYAVRRSTCLRMRHACHMMELAAGVKKKNA